MELEVPAPPSPGSRPYTGTLNSADEDGSLTRPDKEDGSDEDSPLVPPTTNTNRSNRAKTLCSNASHSDSSDSLEKPCAKKCKSFRRLVDSEEESEQETNNTKRNATYEDEVEADRSKPLRRRVIRDLSDSDDEIPMRAKYFPKSDETKEMQEQIRRVVDEDSSNDEKTKESKRNIRAKMLGKFKNRFKNNNKKKENNQITEILEHKMETPKTWASLCDKDSSTSDSGVDDPLPSIRRPDSPDNTPSKHKKKPKTKTKQDEPKRMSAKQAMENMSKIKSESNRMLREKEVSIPYHRPKHITLQDILKRRKLAVGIDGKPLPLKMNDVQLKQYAQQLEERHKEMLQFYKSDDEEKDENAEGESNNTVTKKDIELNTSSDTQENVNVTTDRKNFDEESADNLYDEILEESSGNIENINLDSNCVANTEENSNIESLEEENTVHMIDSEKSAQNLENILNSTEIVSESYTNADSHLISLNLPENSNIQTGDQNVEDIENRTDCNSILNRVENEDSKKSDGANSVSDFNKYKCLENNVPTKDTVSESNEIKELDNNQSSEDMVLTFNDSDRSIQKEKQNTQINEEQNTKEVQYSFDEDFPDDDVDMTCVEDIMKNIDNGKDPCNDSPMLMKDSDDGTIDLGWAPSSLKRQTGVELLKQRFLYFSTMKTPEEQEREKWTKYKPGAQRFKLMQELEKQIEERSAIEWAKKLEEEKEQEKLKKELNGESSEEEDVLDKLEKECDEEELQTDNYKKVPSEPCLNNGENEDEALEYDENDVGVEFDYAKEEKHKRKKVSNALIDDEAEVDDDGNNGDQDGNNGDDDGNENDDDGNDHDDDSESEESSSSSEDEPEDNKPKKGRIIKAFEDSDEEGDKTENLTEKCYNSDEKQAKNIDIVVATVNNVEMILPDDSGKVKSPCIIVRKDTDDLFASQATQGDEEFSLAQPNISISEDILNTSVSENLSNVDSKSTTENIEKITVLFETQPNSEDMDAIVGMCSGTFPSQPDLPVPSSIDRLMSTDSNTQVIGEDILQMCSGRFDEHLLRTQSLESNDVSNVLESQSPGKQDSLKKEDHKRIQELLAELDENEAVVTQKNKYFGPHIGNKEAPLVKEKGKLVLMSSDDEEQPSSERKKKQKKRKKRDIRTLLISDDEEDEISESEQNVSEDEEQAEDEERIVDYDSEENEVVAAPAQKRTKATEFFEKEAELSSEDEWMGSGDEDERGLDRLEREEGDDDVFNQVQLRRELGQMHMQDMLEEDKREVRMLQEILLEDEDLVGPQRQRKFRWRDTDDPEPESGRLVDVFGDTPDDEDESEALWRKQRHERNMYLKQLAEEHKSKENEDSLNVDFEVSIMKTGLKSRPSSLLVNETSVNVETKTESQSMLNEKSIAIEAKFSILQRHRGSFLHRDTTYIQRLAALTESGSSEEPVTNLSTLAAGKKRSFVFATISPSAPKEETKINKRKADSEEGTPKAIKKPRTSNKKPAKKSLVDYLD